MARRRRAPTPRSVPACPPEMRSFVGGLVTLLRQMEAREHAYADEQARLLSEIESLKSEQIQRSQIAQDCIQEVRVLALLDLSVEFEIELYHSSDKS